MDCIRDSRDFLGEWKGVPCTICTMQINSGRNIIQLEHFVLCSMFYDCMFSTKLKTELSAQDRMFKIGLIWSWISGIPTFAAYYQPIPVEIPIYPAIQPLWSPMIRCNDDFNYIPGITETIRTMRFTLIELCDQFVLIGSDITAARGSTEHLC